MSSRIRTLIKGRLYLRSRDIEEIVDVDEFIKAYRVRSYNEMECRSCPHKEDRFSKKYCLPCDNYLGRVDMAEEVNIDRKNYVAVPLGAQHAVERSLGVNLKIISDLRKYPKMERKYKVTVDLYDGSPAEDGTTRINQRKAIDVWKDEENLGVIKAGARSGKTVMAVVASVEIGLKTLVVTGSADLNKQFWQTYCGDGSERICATNMPPERVVVIKKMEDFLKPHDVAIISYQKFIRETADARIETFIKGKYGLLIGDEIHNAAAQAYANFLLKLDIPLRLGLSATPKRKDGRFRIAAAIYGRTVVSLDKVGLKPTVFIRRTNRFVGRQQRAWHLLSAMFQADKERNKQIVDLVFEALDVRGHEAVIVPLDRTEHIDYIVERINARQQVRHRKDRNEPELIAMVVDGRSTGKVRDAKFAEFDDPNSQFRVLVSQRKIVKEGIDIKRPSCVICAIPMSADPIEGAPLFEQLSYRGSTHKHGKRKPEVFIMADAAPAIEKMINGLLRWEILRNDVSKVGDKKGIYIVDESCHEFISDSAKPETAAYGKLGGVTVRR